MAYECPNCGKVFSESDVESDRGVYSGTNSDPYMGLVYDEYFCKKCVDEYRDDTGLLRRVFKGESDKIDFKLRRQ